MKDGQVDPVLHPNGEKQALAVGERLKTLLIAVIYVTTLRRAHQTAAPLASAHPDQLVAVFVHGGVIAAALSIATGAQPLTFLSAANGSNNRLVIHGGQMFVRSFNETSHLD